MKQSVRRRFVGFLNGPGLLSWRGVRFLWRLRGCLSASLAYWWQSIECPSPLPAALVHRARLGRTGARICLFRGGAGAKSAAKLPRRDDHADSRVARVTDLVFLIGRCVWPHFSHLTSQATE